jgi:hypothetical protein
MCWCISSIIISLIVATLISIVLMAIILMVSGNKQEEICIPIPMKVSIRRLKNQEIIFCNSSVFSEQRDTFSIKGFYKLKCNESKFLTI